MCGGDDHLAWKHPVSSEVCRGLRIIGGSIDMSSLGLASWIRVPPQDDAQYDPTVPPPPPPSQSAPHAIPFTLQTKVAPPPIIVPTPILEDPHALASLLAKFRMPKIERYTGIGSPHIHLRLYSTVMRAHGLDEAQMVMIFPMSLSSATHHWFASLDVSCRRTRDDLAQEFLR
ncbi:hypothetical protein CK203_081241 [Vitis vinifera]|uniref:Retrotransposon gag domain-containing protein n=1 Tax=Vitis vinifera TaxID=29760 RepID=A0A438DAK7_VITVI|nr:hypothetical protein CK203_081241 [Vitis vinifera]